MHRRQSDCDVKLGKGKEGLKSKLFILCISDKIKMLTYISPNGEWGLKTFDIKEVPRGLYGYIAKLHDYEKCGFSPDELQNIVDELAELREQRNSLDKKVVNLKEKLEKQAAESAFFREKLNRIRELIQEVNYEQE